MEELYHGNVPEVKSSLTSPLVGFCKILTNNKRKLTALLASFLNADDELHLLSEIVNAQAEEIVMNTIIYK